MSEVSTAGFWDDAYREERDGWDMGTPTPVFSAILARYGRDFSAIGGANYTDGTDVRVAMPCSGRGHDARLFADHGFIVTAIDFSVEALRSMDTAPSQHGGLRMLHADLFTLAATHSGEFDMLVEYTCVCAVDPSRRAELVDVMAAMLKPGGHALMLLFPVDGRAGGPPFAIDAEEWKKLMQRHFHLTHEETPGTSVKPRLKRERLMMWRKREAGEQAS
jgi:methyl halide transferase